MGAHSRMDPFHEPVLVSEILELLVRPEAGVWLDATMGGGGHSAALLDRLGKGARLIGIDRDPEAVEYCKRRFSDLMNRVDVVRSRFGSVAEVLDSLKVSAIQGALLDLGVSSHQIDVADRGFSYLADGRLDMRMDPDEPRTAWEVVNGYSERQLADILYTFGEERASRRIARILTAERAKRPIETTKELSELIRRAVPERWAVKTLSRVFQALRIEVNEELEELERCLVNLYPYLAPGARFAVITWESLSDRMVKRYFRGEKPSFRKMDEPVSAEFEFEVLTRKVIVPGHEEILRNPRARSAKLRCGEKRG